MKKETVIVVDGGGRGAALVEAYGKSPHVERILAIPGNDLMQLNSDKRVQTFPSLKTTSVREILHIAKEANAGLVDVAQDNAVAVGLVDTLRAENIPTIGPTKAAGQIEWDKVYARQLGSEIGLPQPQYSAYTSLAESEVDTREEGYVKARGLAEGKGAKKFSNRTERRQRIKELQSSFADASDAFLIEELMLGEEFSAFAFVSGQDVSMIGYVQDNKKVYNNDKGDNTGGMGGHTPPLIVTSEIDRQVQDIFKSTAIALDERGRPYTGVLYFGGMAHENNANTIEFNSRWGDPEAELLVPGLQSDLYETSMAIINGDLKGKQFPTDGKAQVLFTAASRGYPGDYSIVKGKEIYGIDDVRKLDGVRLYGAGVKMIDGKYYANGGRLLYVVGEGDNLIDARRRAMEGMSLLSVEDNNLHYRTDIAWRDIQRLRQQGF